MCCKGTIVCCLSQKKRKGVRHIPPVVLEHSASTVSVGWYHNRKFMTFREDVLNTQLDGSI